MDVHMIELFILIICCVSIAVLYWQYYEAFGFIFRFFVWGRTSERRLFKTGPTQTAGRIKPFSLEEKLRESSAIHRGSDRRRRALESKLAKKRSGWKPPQSNDDEEIVKRISSLKSILSCGIDHEPLEMLDEISRFHESHAP
jgi:hypothetical protein